MDDIYLLHSRSMLIGNKKSNFSLVKKVNGVEIEMGGLYSDLLKVTGGISFHVDEIDASEIVDSVTIDAHSMNAYWRSEKGNIRFTALTSEWPLGIFSFAGNCNAPIRLKVRTSLALVPPQLLWFKPREYKIRVNSPYEIVFSAGVACGVIKSVNEMKDIHVGGVTQEEYVGPRSDISFILEFPVGKKFHKFVIGAHFDPRWIEEKCSEILGSDVESKQQYIPHSNVVIETPSETLNVLISNVIREIESMYISAPPINGFLWGLPSKPYINTFHSMWTIEAMDLLGQRDLCVAALNTILNSKLTKELERIGLKSGMVATGISPWLTTYYMQLPSFMIPGVVTNMAFRDMSGLEEIIKNSRGLVDVSLKLVENGDLVKNCVSLTPPEEEKKFTLMFGVDRDNSSMLYYARRAGYVLEEQVLLASMLKKWLELSKILGKRDKKVEKYESLFPGMIQDAFWDTKNRYFYDSLDLEKKPRNEIRPSGGIFPAIYKIGKPELIDVAYRRLMKEDLLSSYGIRTLSAESLGYKPNKYHHGGAWSLLTALGAYAAFRMRDGENGKKLLEIIKNLVKSHGYIPDYIDSENGKILSGDTKTCSTLGAIILSVIKGAAGIEFIPSRVEISPSLPDDWPYIRIKGLTWQGIAFNLNISREKVCVENLSSRQLSIKTPSTIKVVPPGKEEIQL
ncbi:MAG: amylo-alpha-1,6-glucosidase [Candidatus Korarchaeota archaeon]